MKLLLNALLLVLTPMSVWALDYAEEQRIIDPRPERVMHKPLRSHSIIITDSGYYPNKISVFAGEEVQFFVTTTQKEQQCMMIQSHNVFASAEKGLVTEAVGKFDVPGKYKIYCPSNKFSGTITVLQNQSIKEAAKEHASRGIASIEEASLNKGKPSYWMPREF